MGNLVLPLAIGLAFGVPLVVYALIRGRVRPAWVWSSLGLVFYLGVGWSMRLVLERLLAPRLMGEGSINALYREGLISYNEMQSLHALNTTVTLVCLGVGATSVLALALFLRRRARRRAARSDGTPDYAQAERQIVGLECSVCHRRILLEPEALFCPECQEPLHHRCQESHRHADTEQTGD